MTLPLIEPRTTHPAMLAFGCRRRYYCTTPNGTRFTCNRRQEELPSGLMLGMEPPASCVRVGTGCSAGCEAGYYCCCSGYCGESMYVQVISTTVVCCKLVAFYSCIWLGRLRALGCSSSGTLQPWYCYPDVFLPLSPPPLSRNERMFSNTKHR